MIDPTPNEIAALEHGGRMGGEYLDSVRCSDLSRLTLDQWRTFIETVVTGYIDRMQSLYDRDRGRLGSIGGEVPF